MLALNLLLTHYDPKLPIIVTAYASDYGIGAVISHRYRDGTEKIIYHACRFLSDTEKQFSQMEKALALVYAVQNLIYIYGRQFTLLTDH